ncbi:MAG: ABC transporter permease [Paludibacteraceae bacterium]|nr:ABC transporter permease [Paludibacteraceae bacterium]
MLGLDTVGRYVELMKRMFSKPDNWKMFGKQLPKEMVKLGIDSIGIIILISIFMGAIMTMQTVLNTENPLLPRYSTGLVLRDTMLLEFSSSIMSLLLAGKVGSNIASEIGSMRITEQIDALEIMGVNSSNYLILPKVVALVLCLPLLVVFSVFFGLIGGMGVAFLPI